VTTVWSIVEAKAPSVWLWGVCPIGWDARVGRWSGTLPPSPPTVGICGIVANLREVSAGGALGLDVGEFRVDRSVDSGEEILGGCVSGLYVGSLPDGGELRLDVKYRLV
jgi:hypothetical protein